MPQSIGSQITDGSTYHYTPAMGHPPVLQSLVRISIGHYRTYWRLLLSTTTGPLLLPYELVLTRGLAYTGRADTVLVTEVYEERPWWPCD